MGGWHQWLDGGESEWTPGVGDGQGGLVCCDSWGRKESDTTEWLNWTELNWTDWYGASVPEEILMWTMCFGAHLKNCKLVKCLYKKSEMLSKEYDSLPILWVTQFCLEILGNAGQRPTQMLLSIVTQYVWFLPWFLKSSGSSDHSWWWSVSFLFQPHLVLQSNSH